MVLGEELFGRSLGQFELDLNTATKRVELVISCICAFHEYSTFEDGDFFGGSVNCYLFLL